jgi:hypothetical protein
MFSAAEILTPEFRQWERVVKRKGAQCTMCSALHWEPLFKMCRTCRSCHAAQLSSWRTKSIKAGGCEICVGKRDKSRSGRRCEYHLDYHNELAARIRSEQKQAGLCTWSRCRNAPLHGYGAGYCEEHLARWRVG